ncbi:MAG TPA: AI-2E family transporter, partial [Gemmataceae bacterium]|nr:AI-2E family transporter [Gemmataceae bacterium]
MAESNGHFRSRLQTAFAGVALGVLIVTVLYFAQTIFIPIALSVFLTFLMTPVVERLEKWIGRTVAVVATAVAAAGLLLAVGWGVTHEMGGLVQTLNRPEYTRNIGEKVDFVQRWFQGGIVDELKRLTRRVEQKAQESRQDGGEEPLPKDKPKEEPQPVPAAAAPVEPITPPWLRELPSSLGRVAEFLAQAALVAVLVVFMLVRREDLRNRVIRLIGHGRLTVTTMALDDATARVSRYLFCQLVINASYGLVFAAGLWFIGVPYAFLWGFLAGLMRYVPYVGIWLAVLPPIALSLAASPGWTMPIWVLGLVAVLELTAANFIEPILYGQSIGVSEVALLVSAAFWAWLWGPLGLILSAPLTVCLVVLGKYVPQLEFFDVLLGDAPVLPGRLVFYQRLLARDQDEAEALVEKYARSHPPEQAYDEFLVPALVAAKRDRDHHDLAEADERYIVAAVAETADRLVEEFRPPAPKGEDDEAGAAAPAEAAKATCLLVPARDETDEMALRLFQGLLAEARWAVEMLPAAALAAELVQRAKELRPAVVCITALPPGGLAHTRYLCKRLRRQFPEMKIAVGLWGAEGDLSHAREALAESGADHVAGKMIETKAK